MSTTIDQRIVEMQFNNKQFEEGVKTSMGSINALKESLDFSNAVDGFEDIGQAANNTDLGILTSSVQSVKNGFSALEVIAVTALVNITNSAINTGKRMLSALTIDPIKTGLNEYETKINSIQTIMTNTASKGTTMDQVTEVINELNTYADKTIYNFAEMTRNIGTFTAAGIGLEDSAAAIQGIANLAAASGSTSMQASTAMYQLSQALSTGTVRLMDWNSVVNAGMGGELFQNALKETAKEMGIAVDAAIDKNGSFRESLQEGWLSADVLNTTLMKFTQEGAKEYAESMQESGKYTEEQAKALMEQSTMMEDAATKVKTFTQLYDTLKESAQSGWGQSWEIIIGNFEEAKELWTGVSDALGSIIGASADARNALLQGWSDLGGRTAMIDAFKNAFEALTNIIKPFKEAFAEIFPPTTSKQLLNITENIRDFFKNLTPGEETMDKLKRTAKGFFSILGIGKEILSGIFLALKPVFRQLTDVGRGVLTVTATLGDWMSNLHDYIKDSGFIIVFFETLGSILQIIIHGIKTFSTLIGEKILHPGFTKFHELLALLQTGLGKVIGTTTNLKNEISDAMYAIETVLRENDFFIFLGKLWDGIKYIFSIIAKGLSKVGGDLFDALASGNLDAFFDLINSVIFGTVAVGFNRFLESTSQTLSNVSGFMSGLSGILNEVRYSLEAWQTNIKANTLIKISVAMGILAASLILVASIDKDKLSNALEGITLLFMELFIIMGAFTVISKGIKGMLKANSAMLTIAITLLILTSSVKKLSTINSDDLMKSITGIGILMGILIASIKILSSTQKLKVTGITNVLVLAFAIDVLAGTVNKLKNISWGDLIKSLTGIGLLLVGVAGFLKMVSSVKVSLRASFNVLAIANAISNLSNSVAILAKISFENILKGLFTIGVLLAQISIFMKLISNTKQLIAVGFGLVMLSTSINILVLSLSLMGTLSWESIGKSLVTLAGSLTLLFIGLRLMPKNIILIGSGLVIVATSLLILSSVLAIMGNFEWATIGKGLILLGGSLLILSIGLHLMKGTLGGTAALVVVTAALMGLVPALSILGAMSWQALIKSLVGLAGAFAIFAIAGAVLRPMVGTLMAVSVAFVIFSVGVALVGAGVLAIATGITTLSLSLITLAASAAGTIGALVASISLIVLGIVDLIPNIANAIATGVVTFIKTIGEGAEVITDSVVYLISAVLQGLYDIIPQFADTVVYLINHILKVVAEYTPSIVNSLFDFIIAVIDGVAARLPELVKSVVNVILVFFKSLVDALKEVDTTVLLQGVVAMGIIAGLMKLFAAAAKSVPAALVGVAGIGLILAEIALILGAIGLLQQIPGLNWLITEGGKLLEAIGSAIGGFIGGIVGGFLGGITSQFPQMGTDLANFMKNIDPFVKGAQNIDSKMLNGVKAIAETILILTSANLLNGISKWFSGGASIAELGKEFAEFGPYLNTFYNDVKNIKPDVIEGSANAAKALSEMANNLPKEGGVAGWLAGENSLKDFASELAAFGPILKQYADDVSGLDGSIVENSANAAKALAEMANNLPKKGGIIGWFAGESTLSDFARELVTFGPALEEYAKNVSDLDPAVVSGSASAASALAELANNLPNQGGLVSWFTGDNTLSNFGEQLVVFGSGMRDYAAEIGTDFPEETVTSSANAAMTLAALAKNLPNIGGVFSWFNGEQNLDEFGSQLKEFGKGLTDYAAEIGTDFPEETVTSSANAAMTLVELANRLPKKAGIFSWFTGEQNLDEFGSQLKEFGSGMRDYADEIGTDFPSETIKASANAAESLAKINEYLPTEGGIFKWFIGSTVSLDSWGSQLKEFGSGMRDYADEIGTDFPSDAVTTSANAAESLAKMNEHLPTEGGIFEWFTGSKITLDTFGDQLKKFGSGMNTYASEIGTEFNPEHVTASANAAKALSEMAAALPSTGGIFDIFTGSQTTLSEFSTQISNFGTAMSGYADALGTEFNPEHVTASANAAKALAEMAAILPSTGGIFDWFKADSVDDKTFSRALANFGTGLAQFYSNTNTINNYNRLELLVNAFSNFMNILNGVTNIDYAELATLDSTIENIGLNSVEKFLETFINSEEKVKNAVSLFIQLFSSEFDQKQFNITLIGSNIITQVIDGILSKESTLTIELRDVLNNIKSVMTAYYDDFYSIGENVSESLGNGMLANKYAASQAAATVAQRAIDAMNYTFAINSPSKVATDIGDNFGGTFVDTLSMYGEKAYSSAEKIAVSAKEGLNKAIKAITMNFTDNLDVNPIIKPVLDLSNVNSGLKGLNTSFGQELAVTAGLNNSAKHQGIQNEQSTNQNEGVTYSFVQNNNSPKALNRLEIYRQTKNLFNASKGMIKK